MAVSEEPHNQDVETLMREGKEAFENDDLEKADQLLHQALELAPDNADLHVDLGNLLRKQKKTVEARGHYQKSIELDPNSFRPLQALGRLEASLDNHEKALKLYLQALELNPKVEECADINVDIGNLYLDFSQLELAQEYYDLAIEQNPNCARAYNNLGNIASRQERRAESLKLYKKAVALDSKNALFKKNLAGGYYYEGIYDLAEKLFLEILECGNDEAVLCYLGKCFYYSKQFEKSIDTLTSLILKTSDSWLLFYAHEYLGKAYTQLNQLDEALTEWLLSLKYFEHSNVYKEIGRLKGLQCKFIEALEYFEKALYKNPEDATDIFFWIWSATCHANKELNEEDSNKIKILAIHIAEHFLNQHPGKSYAYYMLSVFYDSVNEIEKALNAAYQSIDIDVSLGPLYQIIKLNFELEHFETGIDEFKRLLSLNIEKDDKTILKVLTFSEKSCPLEISERLKKLLSEAYPA